MLDSLWAKSVSVKVGAIPVGCSLTGQDAGFHEEDRTLDSATWATAIGASKHGLQKTGGELSMSTERFSFIAIYNKDFYNVLNPSGKCCYCDCCCCYCDCCCQYCYHCSATATSTIAADVTTPACY